MCLGTRNCTFFLLYNFMSNPVNLSIVLSYLFLYLLKLFPYLSNLIIINTKLQLNMKPCVTYYIRQFGELFNQYYTYTIQAITSVINLRSALSGPF